MMRDSFRPIFFLSLLIFLHTVQAAEIIVTSSADSGDFTLRTALQKAPDYQEAVSIRFDPSVTLVRPLTDLPVVSGGAYPITLDGGGTVTLDGSLGTSTVGLAAVSPYASIRGLTILNFPVAGIVIGGDGTSITGCKIGTDGANAHPNGYGIQILAGTGHQIGAAGALNRNVISGNTDFAIRMQFISNGTKIQGNYIGLTADGLLPLPNKSGIECSADSVVIGGDQPGEGNVISGNQQYGLVCYGTYEIGSKIAGNIIGLNAQGTAVAPNTVYGVFFPSGKNIVVGGTGPASRNIISGNGSNGIYATNIENITIQGNYIGTDITGTAAFPNNKGVELFTSTGVVIGGAASGAGNVVSGNNTVGIAVVGGSDSAVLEGNIVGRTADTVNPLSNNGPGIVLQQQGRIGGIASGAGNIVANNLNVGVVAQTFTAVEIRRNSIFGNTGGGIGYADNSNPVAAPQITSSTPISGTAVPFSIVELFVDDNNQGRIYVGTAVANASGGFSSPLNLAAFRGKLLTGTATTSDSRTSPFGPPFGLGAIGGPHVADQNGNYIISLAELLRLIQFYNSFGLRCADVPGSTEDGYQPGAGADHSCTPHQIDYAPQDWLISLAELLRGIQLYNSGSYYACPEGEDGYCAGFPPI